MEVLKRGAMHPELCSLAVMRGDWSKSVCLKVNH